MGTSKPHKNRLPSTVGSSQVGPVEFIFNGLRTVGDGPVSGTGSSHLSPAPLGSDTGPVTPGERDLTGPVISPTRRPSPADDEDGNGRG